MLNSCKEHSLGVPRGFSRRDWRVIKRSRLLSCSQVHQVQPCAFFFLSSGCIVARAGAFGALSVRLALPRPLLVPERALEASGIVCRRADEGCPEEQLHRTRASRGCVTFCLHSRLYTRTALGPQKYALNKAHGALDAPRTTSPPRTQTGIAGDPKLESPHSTEAIRSTEKILPTEAHAHRATLASLVSHRRCDTRHGPHAARHEHAREGTFTWQPRNREPCLLTLCCSAHQDDERL